MIGTKTRVYQSAPEAQDSLVEVRRSPADCRTPSPGKSAAGSRIVFLVDDVTDRGFIGEIWANATHAASGEPRSDTSPLEFVSDHPDAERVCERIITAFSNVHPVVPMRTQEA
jgi:hypothetical protein